MAHTSSRRPAKSDSMTPVDKDLFGGAQVRALRRKRHLTQDQLAQATGVSRSAVAQWETGRSRFSGKARLIAKALDVPVEQLRGAEAGDHRQPGQGVSAMSESELRLLRDYRKLGLEDRACVLRIVLGLARMEA